MSASRSSALQVTDYLRGPERADKEWLHVLAWQGERVVLVNLAMLRGVDGRPQGRTTVFLRDAGGWLGATRTSQWRDDAVHPGRVLLELDRARVRQRRGGLELTAALEDPSIRVELAIELAWPPAPPARTPLGEGRFMAWVVAPCCIAKGRVVSAKGAWTLDGAVAYHDHNWGRFAWGARVGWTWAVATWTRNGAPGAVVYSDMGDRSGQAPRQRTLLVWSGGPVPAVFTGAEVVVTRQGCLRPRTVPRVPAVAGLLVPGTATGVPERLVVTGRSAAGSVELQLRPVDQAQLVVPDEDDDLGCTLIDEVHAAYALEARIGGRAWEVEGFGTLEQVHGG